MNVYFIKCCDNKGFIKIGVANDPYKRLDDLQVGCPYRLEIIAVIKCRTKKHAYSTESYLHKVFRKTSVRGEWFSKVNLKFVDEIINREVEDTHTTPRNDKDWEEIEIVQEFNRI